MRVLSAYLSSLMPVTLVFLLALGCDRRLPPGVYLGGSARTIDSLAEKDVIFRVNGEKVTKRDFLDLQRLQDRMYRLQNGIPFEEASAKVEWHVKANEQRVPEQLMKEVLVRQEARRLGLKPTAAEVTNYAAPVLDNLKTSSLGVDGTARRIGGREGLFFVRLLKFGVLQDKLLQMSDVDNLMSVTAQEITNRIEFVRTFNANADKMNRLAREKLLAAKKEILSGAKFREVAKRDAEVHPEYGEKWATVELGELTGEREQELKKWLRTAKVGDISSPMDLDDGLAVIGLVWKGEGEVPANMQPPMLYTLVRCTMYAREHLPDLTPAETEVQLREWKRKEALRALGKRLMDGAALEFPNGTNFFARVELGRKDIAPPAAAKEEK